MGGREPAEVEEALHELARKELVRPARTSSMDERARVRLLARARPRRLLRADPACGPCGPPRAAAAWIEAQGRRTGGGPGRRARPPLPSGPRAKPGRRRRRECKNCRRRRSTISPSPGERALSLDVGQAERQLARSPSSCAPPTTRCAPRCSKAGHTPHSNRAGCRRRETRSNRLSTSTASSTSRWRPAASSRASRLVLHRLGDPRSERDDRRGRRAARGSSRPDRSSSSAHGLPSGAVHADRTVTPRGSLPPKRRARLAAEPSACPSRHSRSTWRGSARCSSGQAEGVEDMRRALRARARTGSWTRNRGHLRPRSLGRPGRTRVHVPALSVENDDIAFCERRGITELALQCAPTRLSLLAELGAN